MLTSIRNVKFKIHVSRLLLVSEIAKLEIKLKCFIFRQESLLISDEISWCVIAFHNRTISWLLQGMYFICGSTFAHERSEFANVATRNTNKLYTPQKSCHYHYHHYTRPNFPKYLTFFETIYTCEYLNRHEQKNISVTIYRDKNRRISILFKNKSQISKAWHVKRMIRKLYK